ILRDLSQALEATARERVINLTWTIPDREPLVWADASALRRLLLNLVDNALKYTPPGGVVTVRLTNDYRSVAVEVEDNGVGIAPEHLPHVLERFYRADAARTPGNGTGLGLSIASMLAEVHKGQIKISSTVGKGTLARFTLPELNPEAINSTHAVRVSSKRR
ncbi:MAG: ATP-binding protein, partial [Bryobacterales bacterium]|nr:ATP-binding protein [Bryobacterales bacterium]